MHIFPCVTRAPRPRFTAEYEDSDKLFKLIQDLRTDNEMLDNQREEEYRTWAGEEQLRISKDEDNAARNVSIEGIRNELKSLHAEVRRQTDQDGIFKLIDGTYSISSTTVWVLLLG